jgi:hypothetical protein
VTPARGGAAALGGVLAGALASGITAIGGWQADLAAGGIAGLPAISAVVVVAPAAATGVAITTAVLVAALGAASVAALARATASIGERRLFWAGALVVVVAVLATGAFLAQSTLEPDHHTGPQAVIAAAGHSTLLALVSLIALLRLVATRPPDPERGRLVR